MFCRASQEAWADHKVRKNLLGFIFSSCKLLASIPKHFHQSKPHLPIVKSKSDYPPKWAPKQLHRSSPRKQGLNSTVPILSLGPRPAAHQAHKQERSALPLLFCPSIISRPTQRPTRQLSSHIKQRLGIHNCKGFLQLLRGAGTPGQLAKAHGEGRHDAIWATALDTAYQLQKTTAGATRARCSKLAQRQQPGPG